MSHDQHTAAFPGWRRMYGAAQRALPRALREKHGDAMQALFVRDLVRARGQGTVAFWRTALVALADMLGRGVHERLTEERLAWRHGGAADLRRMAGVYVMALFLLTDVMLANYAHQHYAVWQARGTTDSAIAEMLLLAVPFTTALTVPMAVFVAVLLANRRSASARQPVRLAPLLALTGALSLGAFAWNAEVVPRANASLVEMQSGEEVARDHDRGLTLGQLRARARFLEEGLAATPTGITARATSERLAEYRVEIHKKGAIAAGCLVLALLAHALSRRARSLSLAGIVVTSLVVFSASYVSLVAGEAAADRHLIGPALGMWAVNGVLTVLALALLRSSSRRSDELPAGAA